MEHPINKKYEQMNVFADYLIKNRLKRDKNISCYAYKKLSKKGKEYIRIRMKLNKYYSKGEWINLVVKEQE